MHISDNHCVRDKLKKDGENFKAEYLIDRGFHTIVTLFFGIFRPYLSASSLSKHTKYAKGQTRR